ncbi:hypothetical protein E9993_13625 [Labilibacter sediminis]|nr:hypothetical protein E9993_13625 [Labilibacter sediminis]
MINLTQDISTGCIGLKVNKETSSKDFIDILQQIKNEQSLPKDISILVDAPEGFQNVRFKQLTIIANAYQELYQTYNNVAVAMVVNKKRERVLSLVFKNLILQLPGQFNVFGCLDEAQYWLETSTKQEPHCPN